MASADGRRFAGSVVLSLAILLCGIAWTLRVGGDCNLIYHRLAHAKEALEGIQQVVRAEVPARGRVQ